MMRSLVAFLLLSVSPLLCPAGDEGAANAQKYLEKLAQAWSQRPPADLTMGLYSGRMWIGHATFTLTAAPADSGAAFEQTVDVEFVLQGSRVKQHGHSLLKGDLTPVAADAADESPDGKTTRKLTVKEGKWSLHTETNGKAEDATGDVAPNTLWDAGVLLFYAQPDAGTLTFTALSDGRESCAFSRIDKKEKLAIGGKEGMYTAVQSTTGERTALFYYTDDGKVAQVRFVGARFYARPVDASAIGKNLDEPIVVSAPVRVVLDLYVAIKKGDKDAGMALWDLDAMAKAMNATADELKATLLAEMFTEEAKNNLPPPEQLEDVLAGLITSEEKEDEATVGLGGTTYRLHKMAEGPKKGSWLIYGGGK